MAKVLELDAGIDFSDINDPGGDIFKESEPKPDKETVRMQKEEAKEAKRIAREVEKERKAEAKDQAKLEKVAGLHGGAGAQHYRSMIVKYRQHPKFGPHLKVEGFKLEDKILNKMNEKQLGEMFERVRFSVGNRNNGDMLKSMALGGLKLAEPAIEKHAHVKIAGIPELNGMGSLSDSLNRNPEFHDLWDELMIQYNIMGYQRPEVRMLCVVARAGVLAHGIKDDLDNAGSPEARSAKVAEYRKVFGLRAPVEPAIQNVQTLGLQPVVFDLPPMPAPTPTKPTVVVPASSATASADQKPSVEDFYANQQKEIENKYSGLLK
jgi:hypothetical protein